MTGIVEFPRPVAVAEIEAVPREIAIETDANERAALARRFDLIAIATLTATITLARAPGRSIVLRGRLRADVVQRCVVTLDPVEARIEEGFETRFAQGGDAADDTAFDPLSDEIVEPLPDTMIDVGELVAQHLGLAIDPYPRRPDAELATPETVTGAATGTPASPFAILREHGVGRQRRSRS